MDGDSLLRQFTIPHPCAMNWDKMDGDARSRDCAACGKHVRDFTAITPEEAAGLIRYEDDELCGRLYARANGTLSTSAHDTLASSRPTPLQFTIRSIMAVIAGAAAMMGVVRLFADNASRPAPPAPTPRLNTLIMGKMVPRSSIERKPTQGPSKAAPSPPASCAESDGAS